MLLASVCNVLLSLREALPFISNYVYVCVCVRACGRACVRVHVMYATTTTHKCNYLKNVTIGFLMF